MSGPASGSRRVLCLSYTFPVPTDTGQKLRIWALARALRATGHEVTLLTLCAPGEVGRRALPVERLIEVPVQLARQSQGANYLGRLQALCSGLPFSVARYCHRQLRQSIAAELAGGQYDVALCPSLLAGNLPASLPVLLVIDNHNVEHVMMRRFAELEQNPLRRAYASWEARKLGHWERRVNGRAQLAMACSETDRQQLARLCPSTIAAVVPNTIDVETYPPTPEGEPGRVVFTGAMDWIPNLHALVFFADHILPELQRLTPSVQFVAAGRPPAEGFRRGLADRAVHFTGWVPDMRTELARAAVCVVPLQVASGTRFKILEAAAMAKPVVSTRLGAEGLDFIEGREIILEDDPLRFARAVARLLADPAARAALGWAARRRVEQQYGFEVLCDAVRREMGGLAPVPRGAGVSEPPC